MHFWNNRLDLSHDEKKRKKIQRTADASYSRAMEIRIGQSHEPNGVIKFHVPRRDDSLITHTKESSIEYRTLSAACQSDFEWSSEKYLNSLRV